MFPRPLFLPGSITCFPRDLRNNRNNYSQQAVVIPPLHGGLEGDIYRFADDMALNEEFYVQRNAIMRDGEADNQDKLVETMADSTEQTEENYIESFSAKSPAANGKFIYPFVHVVVRTPSFVFNSEIFESCFTGE